MPDDKLLITIVPDEVAVSVTVVGDPPFFVYCTLCVVLGVAPLIVIEPSVDVHVNGLLDTAVITALAVT